MVLLLTFFVCLTITILPICYFTYNERVVTASKFDFFNYFFKIIIFLSVIVFVFCLNRNDIFTVDDITQPYFTYNDIKTADHGRFISWIVMHCVVDGVARLFSIHPMDNYYAIFIRGLIFSFLFYLMVRTSIYINGKKQVSIFLYLFVVFFSFYEYSGRSFAHHNQNFAYLMNLCFFFPPFWIVSKYFLTATYPQKRDLIKNSLWGFILGVSAHFNFIIMFGLLFFLAFYSFFKSLQKLQFIKKIFHEEVIIPLLFFILGLFLSVFSPHFQFLLKERAPNKTIYWYVLENFSDFSFLLFKEMWVRHALEILLIFILTLCAIIIWIKNKKIEKNIVLSYAILFGVLVFNYSLIVCGKTFYDGKSYWFVHADLNYISSLLFITAIIILYSSIEMYFSVKRKYLFMFFFLILMAIFTSCFGYRKINFGTSNKNDKILVYEMEKAIIYYAQSNSKDVYFPKNDALPIYYNQDGCWYLADFKKYLNRIYKQNYQNFSFKELEPVDFIKKARSDGLTFTAEELETLIFTRLIKYQILGIKDADK